MKSALRIIAGIFMLLLSAIPLTGYAQGTALQSGLAKTRGKLKANGTVVAGKPLAGVAVKVRGANETRSGADGTFAFNAPSVFILENARKKGFVLSDADLTSRPVKRSAAVFTIVLEDEAERKAELDAVAARIRRTLNARIREREDSLAALREQLRISDEQYRAMISRLYDEHSADEELIAALAERYTATDWDSADEQQRRISALIIAGELERADSLLNAGGDLGRAVLSALKAKSAISADEADIARRQARNEQARKAQVREAEALAERCLAKSEIMRLKHLNDSAYHYLTLRSTLMPSRLDYLTEAGSFAEIFLGDAEEAARVYSRAMDIAAADSSLAIDYAFAANSLARIAIAQGRPEDAERLLLSLLAAPHASSLGLMLTGSIYSSLAHIDALRGNYADAESKYRQAMRLQRELSGDDAIGLYPTVNDLSMVLLNTGRAAEAADSLERSIEVRARIYGSDSPEMPAPHSSLGHARLALNDTVGALAAYREAVRVGELNYSPRHPDLGTLHSNLARLLLAVKDYGEAAIYYRKSLAALPAGSPWRTRAMSDLALCLFHTGHRAEAAAQSEEALQEFSLQLGPESGAAIEEALILGMYYYADGRKAESERVWKGLLSTAKQHLPADDPVIEATQRLLDELYTETTDTK
ncbi:MAG: tetratricopeptide repeat protein [Muribaculaceae bacterium]|nr:tetratricopeptide repeat protein [Muribaculaceae bacterium]